MRPYDDGPNDVGPRNNTGAVYLFSFDDTEFNGGEVTRVLGVDYSDDETFRNQDRTDGFGFGRAVSLNGDGDRLAVFATGGRYGRVVHLFTFSDESFADAKLADSISCCFSGAAVSLNAAGDRLAIGEGYRPSYVEQPWFGKVYLYTFADREFSGRRLAAVIGKRKHDDEIIDIEMADLEDDDQLGRSVSLNAAGDRLAVGAHGADNGTGAVYLFGFQDTSFSGGRLMASLGKGYSGSKDVDVPVLFQDWQNPGGTRWLGSHFGQSVSLNGAGDRLAVGSRVAEPVFLFTFEDGSFSGGRLAATLSGRVASGALSGDPVGIAVPRSGYGSSPDSLGASVSLNASGDRLAVGAMFDDGFDDRSPDAGAVYLFAFADSSFSGGRLAAVVGKGYSGGRSVDVEDLDGGDLFGASVSLNAAGDRLAVGAPEDDGAGDTRYDAGAVYLFSFEDRSFSGGTLAATVGKDRIGGKDLDPDGLWTGDGFGRGVSLNAAGDRLAVGAPGDDGANGSGQDTGAVYLFSFEDGSWSGGKASAVLGKGYRGGGNLNAPVRDGDGFGRSVSLNASGNRLAVGASHDDGMGDASNQSGAVYLYSFTDNSFRGGSLAATIGRGHAGGRNFDLDVLEGGDLFGSSVSLNGPGDRLAVGAWEDDGNGTRGTAYLFTFRDSSFNGAGLAARLGYGYADGNDVHVPFLYPDDGFGSVALNAAGDRLAVGAHRDDGYGGRAGYRGRSAYRSSDENDGAVYLFSFADRSFAGGRLVAVVGKDRGAGARAVGGNRGGAGPGAREPGAPGAGRPGCRLQHVPVSQRQREAPGGRVVERQGDGRCGDRVSVLVLRPVLFGRRAGGRLRPGPCGRRQCRRRGT